MIIYKFIGTFITILKEPTGVYKVRHYDSNNNITYNNIIITLRLYVTPFKEDVIVK